MVPGLEAFFRIIARFAYLNVLWLLGIVAGLGVVGFFPATQALLAISKRWVKNDYSFPVAKTFIKLYKQSIWRANATGFLILLVATILYVNYRVIQASGGLIPFPVVIAFIILVLLVGSVSIMLFPLGTYAQDSLKTNVKTAIIFAFGRFHITMLTALITWCMLYMSLAIPTLFLFFSGSVGSFLIMWFIEQALHKSESRATTVLP
ncbi:DUF624 domain-containing protein [Paenalkalicoccus suaedae]|uniref:DUF624 domain-containing protein n=1 Tax=Paenalkalicoccus suaedae TaxID=2592382 RepID=A0A859FHL3_9BACI|nr:DUF624 domain-containing protein [Paenalkalicoccus suaedae]QKS72833.1 DUF624 domain-containing protein [Paenalkalicoccus suaedae]